jgi:phage tail-like protein
MDFGKVAGNAASGALAGVGNKLMSGAGSAAVKALGGTLGPLASSALNMFLGSALGNEYPTTAFRFGVEVNGIVAALFTEASGMEWEIAPESFHEGGHNINERTLMGPAKFSPLTLKRGFTASGSEFFLWLKSTFASDKFNRRNLSVVVFNQEAIEVGRFNFKNAFIRKYSGPSLNSAQNEVGVESVELVYDYFEYQPRDMTEIMAESALNAGASALMGLLPGR